MKNSTKSSKSNTSKSKTSEPNASKPKSKAASVTQPSVSFPAILSITATEFQRHFGKYVDHVEAGGSILITKNGKRTMRLAPVVELQDASKSDSYEPRTPGLKTIFALSIHDKTLPDFNREKYLLEKHGPWPSLTKTHKES